MTMRAIFRVIFACVLSAAATAQQPLPPSAGPREAAPAPPAGGSLKESRRLYQRALRLSGENKPEEAFTVIQEATALNGSDYAMAAASALMKQQLVSIYTERANAMLESGRFLESLAVFRQALELDPENAFLLQRIQDASSAIALPSGSNVTPLPYAGEPVLAPVPGVRTVTHRGDSRRLLEVVGRTFGLRVMLDESVQNKQVRFDLTADFGTISAVAMQMAKVFAIPMAEDQVLFAADTPEIRRRMERFALQTFLANPSSPQELQDISNILRTVLEARFVGVNAATNIITVRAPMKTLRAAELIIQELSAPRPELMIEVHAIQLSRSRTRNLGIDLPLQFTIFNVPTELRQLLNQPGAKELIDRLVSGGLTPADAAALAGLLAAGRSGSPLTQPFATFGGGTTLSGVVIPGATARFELNEAEFSSLQRMTLRSQQGQPATFRVGDRIPVVTATFNAPPRLPGQTAQQFIPPIFNYEELGVTLKTTPTLNEKGEVNLQLELQLRSLTGVNINGIPAIANREYKGTVTLQQGEVSILAGSVETANGESVRGLPFLSHIPGFRNAFAATQKLSRSSELLFLITPRVVRGGRMKAADREAISLD